MEWWGSAHDPAAMANELATDFGQEVLLEHGNNLIAGGSDAGIELAVDVINERIVKRCKRFGGAPVGRSTPG